MKNKEKTSHKYTSNRWLAIIVAVLIGVVMIPINLIVSKIDVDWDMTPNNIYTADLSATTLNVLNGLDETINIYFAFELDDLVVGDDYDGRILKNVLEKYGENPNINLITGYPDDHPEIYSQFSDTTVNVGDIIVQGKNNYKQISANSMFLSEYTESTDTTAYYFVGENYITSAIQYVKDGFQPSICFLRGHGELSVEDNFNNFRDMLQSYNYEVVTDLNLTNSDIPDNCKIIIVASPTSDFTTAETTKISKYLENGGNIVFMMSPNDDTSVTYENLQEITGSFGIFLDYDKVKENDEDMCYQDDPYTIACYLNPTDWNTEAQEFVDEGRYVVMPASRSFYAQSSNEDLEAQPLIYTTTTAVGEPFGIEDYTTIENENLILSAYCEDSGRNDAKLLVFGNSEFITDEVFEQEYTSTTVSVLLGGLSWMYSSSQDMGIPNRSYEYDYMTIDNNKTAYTILAVMIAFPVLIIATGIVIWLRRRNA